MRARGSRGTHLRRYSHGIQHAVELLRAARAAAVLRLLLL
jgi:hypothetical protein